MNIHANDLLPLSPSNHMQYFNTFLFCNCWHGIKDSLEINFFNMLISLENGFVDWAKLWNKMSTGYILCVCALILYHFDYMIIAVHLLILCFAAFFPLLFFQGFRFSKGEWWSTYSDETVLQSSGSPFSFSCSMDWLSPCWCTWFA